jgi:diacylglycerol kinase (ATP)
MVGVIINPKSGKKSVRVKQRYLTSALDARKLEYRLCCTQYAGHAIEIARSFVEDGIDRLVVIGGDGTVSEVVNGVFTAEGIDTSKVRLALIPSGTGNDWARYWGLTRNYRDAVATLLDGVERLIDVGRVSYFRNGVEHRHYFINSVGVGIDHKVVHTTGKLKFCFGSHAIMYFVGLLGAVFTYRPRPLKIVAPAFEYDGKVLTLNIGNGCYSGGGMKQNPDATPFDGLLDLMFIKRLTFWDILTGLPLLFRGNILKHPAVSSFRSAEISLQTSDCLPFEADGIEVHACGPYTITALSKRLTVVCKQ